MTKKRKKGKRSILIATGESVLEQKNLPLAGL